MYRRCRSFVLVLATGAMALPAQGGAPAGPDKEVGEKLAKLKEVVMDRKCARDTEGLDLITVLVKKWQAGLGDKDKAAVVKGLDGVLAQGKVREPDKTQIYTAAATALGQLGKDGAKPLQAAFDSDRFPRKEPWVPLRENLLKALGKTKDESMVKFLVDVARRSPEAGLQAAAGEALGNFDDSKEAIRKEIVNSLLIKYGEMDSRAHVINPADIEAQNMRDRLAVVSGKWNETLRKLTKQNFDTFPEWNEWYNKNKGNEWK